MKEIIEELKFVHASTLGESLQRIQTFDEVLALLREGGNDIPAVVQWSEDGPQSVVLKRLEDESIVFFNPAQRDGSQPRTVILEGGPVRTVVGSGEESLAIEAFEVLFEQQQLVCLTYQ